MTGIPLLGPDEVRRSLGFAGAVGAIEAALRAGFDPAGDLTRIAVPLTAGEFLVMPSETPRSAGIKVLTVGPGDPARGVPRIQGYYLLFESTSLTPVALLDGASLTTLRTPAVSVAAVRPALLRRQSPLRLAVFGAGPQGRAHVAAVTATLAGHREVGEVTYVVRSPELVDVTNGEVVRAGDPAALAALASADLVICATTSRVPLFDSSVLREDVVVIAVGSHERDARELDSALIGRAQVIVEDRSTALRECGDIVMAVAAGAVTGDQLIPMAEVVTGRVTLSSSTPAVFKSSGMSWEDLVIAEAVHDAWRSAA